MTRIDAATLQAYRETEYRVAGGVVLRIGAPNSELAQLHRRYHAHCSAFITACNPRSERLGPDLNAQRQQALAAAIARLGHPAIAGVGQHPTGDWPVEPSYLVPGLGRSAALRLAEQFEQHALVWADADAVPQLLLVHQAPVYFGE